MKKIVRAASILAAAALLMTIGAGCGDGGSSSSGTQPEIQDVTFPLEEPVTLSVFMISDVTDNPVIKELEKRTNVKIECIAPASASTAAEEYTMMVQSQDLPDIIRHTWFGYEGGLDKAIDDGAYIDLTPYVDQIMPNFKAALDKNPAARRLITTTKGRIGHIGAIADPDEKVRPPYLGPIMRKDFLDAIQMAEPVTINDWYNTLTAFKRQLQLKSPLVLPAAISSTDCFLSAYGVGGTLMVEDGKVQFGLMQEGARLFTEEMNKWVKEGLLTIDPSLTDKTYASNDIGAWVHGFYMLDSWKKTAASPNYRAVGVPYPVLNTGDTISICGEYGVDPATPYDNGGFSISGTCEHPEIAAKWLDYLFSPEGRLLASYGIENDTFTYDAQGEPQFTDKVLQYEKGVATAIDELFFKFSPAWDSWSEVKAYPADSQEAITTKWANVTAEKRLPSVVTLYNYMSDEDRNIISTPVYLYLQDSVNKMVTGELPLSYWDEMIQQAKVQGAEEQLDVYQRAYDQYMAHIS